MKIVAYRRKREGRTDYLRRRNMLNSNMNRLVVRKSNKYIIAQVVESKEAQDKVLFGVTSKELLEKNWPKNAEGSLKSIPAAYLTGALLGKKVAGKIKKVILDIGLNRSTKGNRLYAVVKGISDSGIIINCNPGIFPSKERLSGQDLKNKVNVEEIKSKILK